MAGLPLALIAFILLGFVFRIPFLKEIDATSLVDNAARKAFDKIGTETFIRTNYLMLAIFVAA